MSYLALARKYRPTSFKDIVGQEHVVRTLENAIELDRVHHAFLFTGARGVGKTSTARLLASALNSEGGPSIAPASDDPICAEIAAGSCPDVLEIDGASNNGVDSVRELRETVRYLPSRARYKLYIIDEVHMLSQAAFNALLKTLEEPPPHVKFIFATTEPQKIPVTILSRCQRFDFRTVSVEQLTAHLVSILEREGLQLGTVALSAIVREARGSVRDALSLLDQVLSYSGGKPGDAEVIEALGIVDRQSIFALFDAVLARDADRLLGVVAEADARGYDLADVAGILVEHSRDLMVAQVASEPAKVLCGHAPGDIESIVAQAKRLTRAENHRMFGLMAQIAEDVRRSTLPRVSLEMGLLRLLEVEPASGLTELLERLDGLVAGTEAGETTAVARAKAAPVAAPMKAVVPSAAQSTRAQPAGAEQTAVPPSWRELVNRVKSMRPLVASMLEHASVRQFSAEGVVLGYAERFYGESMRETENRELLKEALKEQFGVAVPLEVQFIAAQEAGEQTSLARAAEDTERERVQRIRDDAVQHPAVRDAVEILGGEIKEVQPIGDAASGLLGEP